MKKTHAVGIVLFELVLMIALMAFATFFTTAQAATVPEGYVGIVVKRGAAMDEVLSPGKHWTNPFTTSVVLMDTRWQKYSTTTAAFSKDIQQVDIVMTINYALSRTGATKMYRTVGVEYADKIILPLINEATKSIFAKYSAEQLISNRDQISEEVFGELSQELEFYDLRVKEVAIEDIDFSDAFTDAIEKKQVATQKKLQVATEQEQQTLVAKAEAERAMIQAQAEAEERLIRAKAEAEAVKIAADAEAYRLEMESKNITDNLIRKATIEKWDGKLPTITGSDAVPLVNVEEVGGV